MSNADEYARMLAVTDALRRPLIRSAIQALDLRPGSRGLDAGCGIGLQAVVLAEAVGPKGHVTGLDLSPELLTRAEEIAAQAGLAERITFRQGDVTRLPFDDDGFDWAWSADCVGYGPMEPLPLIRELARVVRPGGIVAVLAWSSEMLLPGYPRLEARLDGTSAGMAPFAEGRPPERHFLRTLGWFRRAGLVELAARTLVADAHVPLSADQRDGLVTLLEMRWPGAESELSQEDQAEFRRLCLPESPDFIVDHPDYYAFFTYSLFWGSVNDSEGRHP